MNFYSNTRRILTEIKCTRVNRWQKDWKEKKNVEYSIPIERNWLDSSFVARIGKKRRRVSPLARRGGSKAQATSERERRAGGGGGGGGGGRREGTERG